MTIAEHQAEEQRTYEWLRALGHRRCYECGGHGEYAWRYAIGDVLLCDSCRPQCECIGCKTPALFGTEFCIEHQDADDLEAVA